MTASRQTGCVAIVELGQAGSDRMGSMRTDTFTRSGHP